MADRTLDQFAEDLRTESGGKLRARIQTLMKNLSTRTAGYAQRNAATKLHSRTGALVGSIYGSALLAAEGIGVELRAGGFSRKGQPVPYARVHEYGATITGNLRIPIKDASGKGPALTKTGVDRYASPLRQTGAGLFFRKGNALFKRSAPDGDAWYALKRQVKIPKRPYLRPAIEKLRREMPKELQPLVRASVLDMPSPKAS